MKVACEGINDPAAANENRHYSILKKNTRAFLHIGHLKLAVNAFFMGNLPALVF